MIQEQSAAYPLGGSQTEQQRLLSQASEFELQAREIFGEIDIRHGGHALDIGCGPIGILDLLSERVGPKGVVVGVEREDRFVSMARSEIARRGLSNVEIVQADALDTRLKKGTFDLVHERLLMINVSARDELLREMISLLRPGGTIVLEDVDDISYTCEPPHPSWSILLDAFHTVFHENGGNAYIGRTLPVMLRNSGIRNVQVRVHVRTISVGDYRRTHLLSLLDSLCHKVIASGLLSEAELTRHRSALLSHLNDPGTFLIDKLLVQAWGQR